MSMQGSVAGSPEEAGSYFEAGLGMFVFSNGVLPLLHIFFFILFLGVLYGLLRGAEDADRGGGGVRGALPAAALAGGILFATLEAAGFTAEILFPAALQRFGLFEPDAAFVLVSLTLATWLYHFCQIGASAMVLVTSLVALNTGVLPRWLALAELRGRAADALARRVGACGCPSGITMDSSGLGANA